MHPFFADNEEERRLVSRMEKLGRCGAAGMGGVGVGIAGSSGSAPPRRSLFDPDQVKSRP